MSAPLIVAVDDDSIMLGLLSIFLKSKGYRILTCSRTAEAIACITREQPDAVILDLSIEARNDGWDVCAALAMNATTATIPIIICTAVGPGRHEPPASLQLQYLAFLDKPFSIEALESAVESALTFRPS